MSKNQVFEELKPLKQAKTKLAILQGQASKQVKGSKNQRQTYNNNEADSLRDMGHS
jgi:putative transposase